MEFSRAGDNIIMRLEEYDTVRTIHMNPKDVAPPAHTLYGFSRGRWEGRTLVVETDHIAAGYFDHEGTPQSDQIKTVEDLKGKQVGVDSISATPGQFVTFIAASGLLPSYGARPASRL